MNRLWAITCLFNPAGYEVRNKNYRVFRQKLPLPLVTVELAFDEPFALGQDDAEILIQIRGGDRMWQKERLLNLALSALPNDCDQVMWIDADILAPDPKWVEEISAALDRVPVLQAFESVNMRGPNDEIVVRNVSTLSALQHFGNPETVLASTLDRSKGAPCSGHAWAARRDVLASHGFYDGCIVGGGDSAFLCAATGNFEKVMAMHRMGPMQRRRYLAWAEAIHRDIAGNCGVLRFHIDHLWHGSIENRRGAERHIGLSEIGFDPYRDVSLNDDKVWQWASDRPDLHRYVGDYFYRRKEDEAGMALR